MKCWRVALFISLCLGFATSNVRGVALDSTGTLMESPPQQSSPLIDKAMTALNAGDLRGAEAAFSEAAKQQPQASLPYLGLAEVAGRRNDMAKAESWLKKALSVDPRNAELIRTWARFEFRRGNYRSAETALKKVIAITPDSVPAHLNLAHNYLYGLKDPAQAMTAYRQALKLEPGNLQARAGVAVALVGQGRHDQAIKEYESMAKDLPTDPAPIHAIARIHASRAKIDLAVQTLERALKVSPDYTPALIEKGDLYLLKNDVQSAVAAYQAAVKTPNPAVAHFKLGTIYQAQKKWADAEGAYLAAVKSDAQMFGAYNNLAWMSADRKDRLDDALTWAKKAVELAPKNSNSHDTLGWVYRARGELDLAAKSIEQAIALAPKQPNFHYRLGLVRRDQGRKPEAVAAFKKSIEISDKNKIDFPNAASARQELEKLAGQ